MRLVGVPEVVVEAPEVAGSLRGTPGLETWIVTRVVDEPDVVVVEARRRDTETMRAAAAASHDDPNLPRVVELLHEERRPRLRELDVVSGVGVLPPPRAGVELVRMDELADEGPGYGLDGICSARLPRVPLGLEHTGITHYRVVPEARFPFGHRHAEAEETFLVLSGSGVARLDDDERALTDGDVLRVGPEAWRSFEAGPDGLELLAVGPLRPGDGELRTGWWAD